MDRKITDDEIVKAKEIIKNLHAYCFVSQPTYKQMGYVFCEKDFDILNELIDDYNRQKTEIEKLEKIEHNSLCETETYKGGE